MFKQKYQVREREGTIYASSNMDRVSHMDNIGDVNSGKAWKTVRRPSDMASLPHDLLYLFTNLLHRMSIPNKSKNIARTQNQVKNMAKSSFVVSSFYAASNAF
jgi:hypothetical protein